jgi:hypothetical protein
LVIDLCWTLAQRREIKPCRIRRTLIQNIQAPMSLRIVPMK